MNDLNEFSEWQTLERLDFGFSISYPNSWNLKYTQQGIEINPSNNPGSFDADLGRMVSSPGINLSIVNIPNPEINMVDQFFNSIPTGYKGYKFIKKYDNNIKDAKNSITYEFEYGIPNSYFTAFSLLVQKGTRLFSITASASSVDFGKYRTIIKKLVFSFRLL